MKFLLKKILFIIDNALNKVLFANYFFKKFFLNIINKGLINCDTILEIGAGKNSYLRLINKPFRITAIDIHEETLLEGFHKNIFDEIIVGNATYLDKIVQPDSFDAVVAFDFLEHLEKHDGYKFLEKCEKIARKTVIIFTPNGFLKQPPSKDNPFQEHKSGWAFNEMKKLNYAVYGVNGAKCLSGKYNIPRIKPISFGNFIRNISVVILSKLSLENHSASILCIKQVEKS